MSKFFSFIEARLLERSTQVQLLTLLICGVGATGLVTMGQLTSWTGEITAMLAVAAPIAGMVVPDATKTIVTGQAADVLINAATTAVANRVPGASQVAESIAQVLDTAAPVLNAADALIASHTNTGAAPVVAPVVVPVATVPAAAK